MPSEEGPAKGFLAWLDRVLSRLTCIRRSSIIFFTTGAGPATACWADRLGRAPRPPRTAASFRHLRLRHALGLVGAGLLSSLGHLGHPERAWRL